MARMRVLLLGVFVALLLAGILSGTREIAAQGILNVHVRVNPEVYRGRCPGEIVFTGRVEVDRAPIVLNYEWERSDGAKGQRKTLHVHSPETRTVTIVDRWHVGGHAGDRIEVWERLRVRSGNADVSSPRAVATVECRH